MLLSFDQSRDARILILPALFDEANKLRRFTISVMRGLDEIGIDSFLPDLPGCNESMAPLPQQSLQGWREAVIDASQQFSATHVLSLRGGALLTPPDLPGWRYAPVAGAKILSAMLRAQLVSARESGQHTTRETLVKQGKINGLLLNGWDIGPVMLNEMEQSAQPPLTQQKDVAQSDIGGDEIGGAGLWLRAEPGENADQARALVALIENDIMPVGAS